MQTPVESWIVWMTCVGDGREHAVTDEQLAAGSERDRGVYDAMCGQTIAPHAMTHPPGRRCADCSTVVRAAYSPPEKDAWWRRGPFARIKRARRDAPGEP